MSMLTYRIKKCWRKHQESSTKNKETLALAFPFLKHCECT